MRSRTFSVREFLPHPFIPDSEWRGLLEIRLGDDTCRAWRVYRRSQCAVGSVGDGVTA